MTRLAQNLGMLCRSQRSVSEVCRRIGINRQQFGRYLSGAGRPSAHNLQRICDYFGITEADLLLEPAALREKVRAQPKGHGSVAGASTLDRALRGAFPGDVRLLRRYVGLYHYYFRSPTWPERIVRGLVQLREQNGLIRSRSVTRARNRGDGMQYRSLYEGLATMLHNQIFLVEVQKTALDAVVETILYPAARSRGGADPRCDVRSVVHHARSLHGADRLAATWPRGSHPGRLESGRRLQHRRCPGRSHDARRSGRYRGGTGDLADELKSPAGLP